MSIIWFLILFFSFFNYFYFSIALLGIFFVWVHFHPSYFFSTNEGPFDGSYVFDDLGEHRSKDSDDWDKLGFYFGPNGI
jgi:hypothetical protein